MKKKELKSIKLILKVVILIIALCTAIFFVGNFSKAEELPKVADSGHGTSYHGGSHHSSSHSSSRSSSRSSRSSSSSRSSGSSSYRGSGGSSGSLPAALLIVIFGTSLMMVFIPLIISSFVHKPVRSGMNNSYNTYDDNYLTNKIKKVLPNFDRKQFLEDGYKIYVDVQNAWMNFKLDDVKDVITDEMYNMYSAQLELMKTKGEQNIMSGFVKRNAFLKNVSVQNNTIAVTAMYIVEFYDYIVNEKSKKVLRGSKSKKVRITYELTYRKTLDENTVIDHCPNCGAKIEDANGSATCKYCGSKIVYENSKWILTNKKNVDQTWA